MTNARENILRVFRHEKVTKFPRSTDTAFMMFPGEWGGPWGKGDDTQTDWYGVHWTPVPNMGQMVTETGTYLLTDLENWREQIKIPFDELEKYDWAADAERQTANWDRVNQMGMIINLEGHFERLHSLMGFEEALMAFYLNPDELDAFFAELTEYKIRCFNIIKEYYNPDGIVYHDDWGTNKSMFFSSEHWRKHIKEPFRRIVDECHRLGMYFELHSCGHIMEVLDDVVNDIGIDSIQTLQYPQNDIKVVKDLYGEKLVTRGGYDGQKIIAPGVPEDEIRKTIRYSLETLGPEGHHIPYVYVIGTDFQRPMEILEEEILKCETELYGV